MLVSSEFDFLDCLIKSDSYSDCLQASLRKKVCTLSLSSSDSWFLTSSMRTYI
jgi:hypothetical protein